jgi:hypothetical protein
MCAREKKIVKTQKALCFDAFIEKKVSYKPKRGRTPHHTTRPREAILGEQLAHLTTQDENTKNNLDACYNRHQPTILGVDASHTNTKGTTLS